MIKIHTILLFFALAITQSVLAQKTANNAGPHKPDILFGMSTALTGQAEKLGQNMLLGFNAGLERINRQGGIQGRWLRILALDDGYEPAQTTLNMQQLIKDENVQAIVGNVGTPTAIAAIPIANREKVLLFAPYTGAGVLRKQPPDRYVINYRASYAEETAAMVNALISHAKIKPHEIAFFTQRDGYGDAGFNGGIQALKQHGLTDLHNIAHGRYKRNTLSVENGLADILLHKNLPKAVIMVGAYAPCASFIQLAQESGLNVLFLNVSFVGSAPLAESLGKKGAKVIVTQVVPHPENQQLQIIREYQSDLKLFAPKATRNFGNLEGYIAARVLVQAMLHFKDEPNRENIVNSLESLGDFELGTGTKLHLSKKRHQASHSIWPTQLNNGKFIPFKWSDIGALMP